MYGPGQSGRAISLPCIHIDALFDEKLGSFPVLLLNRLNEAEVGSRRADVDRYTGQTQQHSESRHKTQGR